MGEVHRALVCHGGVTRPKVCRDLGLDDQLAVRIDSRNRELTRLSGANVQKMCRGRIVNVYRGAMGIAGGLWRLETRVTPSVPFSIPASRRAFCPGESVRRN